MVPRIGSSFPSSKIILSTWCFENEDDKNPDGEWDGLTRVDAAMTQSARSTWRWRIVYLRALIDMELFERKGKLEGVTLKSAFEELTRIYHAESAHSMPIKPPQIK
jgi:hypothetical protein